MNIKIKYEIRFLRKFFRAMRAQKLDYYRREVVADYLGFNCIINE